MQNAHDSLREKLMSALEQSDRIRRAARAERIVWLSQHNMRPSTIAGPADTLTMLDEAHDCFAEGHFIAALLLALAVIEQTVTDELIEHGLIKYGDTLKTILEQAKTVFPSPMLSAAEELRKIRNPYSHRKGPEHEHALANRYRGANTHPRAILEADAKKAVALMYEYFRYTLRKMGD